MTLPQQVGKRGRGGAGNPPLPSLPCATVCAAVSFAKKKNRKQPRCAFTSPWAAPRAVVYSVHVMRDPHTSPFFLQVAIRGAEGEGAARDLRLRDPLDGARHFAQRKVQKRPHRWPPRSLVPPAPLPFPPTYVSGCVPCQSTGCVCLLVEGNDWAGSSP